MSRDLAGYARSGAWSVVAQAIQMLGVIVLSIVVVRSLTTADYGVLSLARQITTIVVLASGFALERAALRFIPELVHHVGPEAAARFFWKTLLVRVVGWVPFMALVIALGSWLDSFFQEDLATYATIGAVTALVFSVHNHVRGCATARFATRRVASASALGTVATLVSTVLLLRMGLGITGVLVGSAIGMLFAAVFMLPAAITSSTRGVLETGPREGDAVRPIRLRERRFLTYALPFGGIALLNYVVHSQTEVFFLARFHGPEWAGYFQLGFLFSQRLIDFLPLALWEVSMAGFSRIAVRDPEKLPEALHGYLTLLYLVIAPVACMGVAFSSSAIRMLYTEAYLPAAIVSQAYFCMAAFAAFGAPVGMIVYARERVGAALRAYALFGLVNVGLDLLLIPRFGLWGAIVGLALAKLLAVLLMARLAWEEVPELRVPWGVIARAFAASTPALLWMLVQERWTQPWQIVLGAVVAGLAVLLAYRGLNVVGDRERELIAGTRLPLRRELLMVLCSSRGEGVRS